MCILLFAIAFKNVKERQLLVGRAKTIERAMEKRSHKKKVQNRDNKLSKEVKSDNFCYRKVGRAISKWGAIEKSPILLSQYWINEEFVLIQ